MVREMGVHDGSARYDPDIGFHINLFCVKCGKIEDYDCVSFEEIAPNLNQKMGFKVFSHNFEVRGLCSDCQSHV